MWLSPATGWLTRLTPALVSPTKVTSTSPFGVLRRIFEEHGFARQPARRGAVRQVNLAGRQLVGQDGQLQRPGFEGGAETVGGDRPQLEADRAVAVVLAVRVKLASAAGRLAKVWAWTGTVSSPVARSSIWAMPSPSWACTVTVVARPAIAAGAPAARPRVAAGASLGLTGTLKGP